MYLYFFQRSDKMNNKNENPYLFDTFKINEGNDNCHLQSARLTVGNGIYYPEIEYSVTTSNVHNR